MTLAHAPLSWWAQANGHQDFPLHNLPLGIFSQADGLRRPGVALGEHILDLRALDATGLLSGLAQQAVLACADGYLNGLFEQGPGPRRALRERLLLLLSDGAVEQALVQPCLIPAQDCSLHLPARIGDYTDFYVGIEHARNVGRLFRPDNPLLPNYKYLPVAYHGRASTLRPSGTNVRRPRGQRLAIGASEPEYGPCAKLDFELELGIWLGQGNVQGEPLPIAAAGEHIAGFCLLNDWSARDMQAWEYQPLGPFLSKSFVTSLSPWVITPEALAPLRCAQPSRPAGDPAPLAYLWSEEDQRSGALAIELEVWLLTALMREHAQAPERISLSNTQHMYWTVAQMVAHHTANGCQLQAGDLFGSGTLSGPEPSQLGSLMEMTLGGTQPLTLANGEQRYFLEDGDEVILRARCSKEGFGSLGFGECRGRIVPA
jgi:fumarylacetoacetase